MSTNEKILLVLIWFNTLVLACDAVWRWRK